MRKTTVFLLGIMLMTLCFSCNDYETYGDKKEKERKAIRTFIADSAFTIISEKQFHEQGNMTDTARREFVYMENDGVYMQIQHKGCGEPLRDGETCDLLVRFLELGLVDSSAVYNDVNPYDVDIMNVSRQGNTYTASFTSGLWYSTYDHGETVPQGILICLPYINVGRPRTADDHVAKVRLIVPHSKGTSQASGYVYPYYYEISFQRKTDL